MTFKSETIKIVTGIRRCGKSSLLDLFHQYLTDNGVADANIIHINLESLRYRDLYDYLSFYDYVSERIPKDGKTYLIFDELQTVEHWKKATESFRLDFNVDVYITGSNACLLSAEFSTLLSGNNNIAGKTVEKYISLLRSAFIIYSVGRYDVKGKKLLKTPGKNYISDMGFRNLLLGYRDADRGHIIENIVFLELMRRDYRVYIGKVGETEVDFVAEKPNDKLYIQVTESMQSPETRERELRPLRMIPDNYEKIVLSMDRNYINSYDGIKSLYLIDWLLS